MGLPSHNARLAKPNSAGVYVRHRPETTLLYQIVHEYWPEFQAELAGHGRYLPAYVTKEFDEYLKCGRLGIGATARAQSFRVLLTPLTYIPVGEVLTLQTLPDCESENSFASTLGEVAGFSCSQTTR